MPQFLSNSQALSKNQRVPKLISQPLVEKERPFEESPFELAVSSDTSQSDSSVSNTPRQNRCKQNGCQVQSNLQFEQKVDFNTPFSRNSFALAAQKKKFKEFGKSELDHPYGTSCLSSAPQTNHEKSPDTQIWNMNIDSKLFGQQFEINKTKLKNNLSLNKQVFNLKSQTVYVQENVINFNTLKIPRSYSRPKGKTAPISPRDTSKKTYKPQTEPKLKEKCSKNLSTPLQILTRKELPGQKCLSKQEKQEFLKVPCPSLRTQNRLKENESKLTQNQDTYNFHFKNSLSFSKQSTCTPFTIKRRKSALQLGRKMQTDSTTNFQNRKTLAIPEKRDRFSLLTDGEPQNLRSKNMKSQTRNKNFIRRNIEMVSCYKTQSQSVGKKSIEKYQKKQNVEKDINKFVQVTEVLQQTNPLSCKKLRYRNQLHLQTQINEDIQFETPEYKYEPTSMSLGSIIHSQQQWVNPLQNASKVTQLTIHSHKKPLSKLDVKVLNLGSLNQFKMLKQQNNKLQTQSNVQYNVNEQKSFSNNSLVTYNQQNNFNSSLIFDHQSSFIESKEMPHLFHPEDYSRSDLIQGQMLKSIPPKSVSSGHRMPSQEVSIIEDIEENESLFEQEHNVAHPNITTPNMQFGVCTTMNEGFMISKDSYSESSKFQSIGLLKSTPTCEEEQMITYDSGDDMVLADEHEGYQRNQLQY